ncbi:MAG TPA: YicC/YloC family endoribonuclease [Bryobacteraceae bacterium]|nr:YicC/YloC family endoribonuclease [Bryobacteraceae bacterium]
MTTSPIRSMTGFARVQKPFEQADIVVTLKSVNHRGLDLHFHLGSELDSLEAAMRATLKRSVLRGHVDIRCSLVRAGNGASSGLNLPLFRSYVAAFRKAAAEEGMDVQPDLNRILLLPGVLGASEDLAPDASAEKAILAALEEALEVLNQFRAREGAELAAFISEQNALLRNNGEEMQRIRSGAIPAFQKRLQDRLQELLGNSNLDPQRLIQEAALAADRSDIGEEIARLQIHSRQLDEILDSGGEVGKRLDFLLQELNRETNTILSKTSGLGDLGLRITELALAGKAAIEKIREQALNLE